MVTKRTLIVLITKKSLSLTKIHMVTKPDDADNSSEIGLSLTKIHMVTKPKKSTYGCWGCLSLTKIHMVTKRTHHDTQ